MDNKVIISSKMQINKIGASNISKAPFLIKAFALCSIFIFFYEISFSYAAYVQEGIALLKSKKDVKTVSVFTDIITDVIYDRGAKHQSDDMRVNFYGVSPGIIYKDKALFYGGIGIAKAKEAYDIDGSKVEWESEYGSTWITGGCVKFVERDADWIKKEAVIFITSDIQYRNTDLKYDSIVLDSTRLNSSDVQYSSMEYNDWHTALTCGMEIGDWILCAGAKYSDFESCVRLITSGVEYQKDNAEADDNLGVFIGVNYKAEDRAAGKLQISFIDEKAVSGAVTLKF